MEIKVLGSGCANCVKLEKVTMEAAKELGISDPVIKVTEIKEIMSYAIMSTPALEEIKKCLQGESGAGSCGCKGGCCN
jgi:hypothetical protein